MYVYIYIYIYIITYIPDSRRADWPRRRCAPSPAEKPLSGVNRDQYLRRVLLGGETARLFFCVRFQ